MNDDRLRRIYNDQRSVYNGSVHGRLITQPVVNRSRGLTDSESGAAEEDDEKTQFFQQTFPVTVTGLQYINLTYIPLTHSEHIYWKPAGKAGIYLEEGPDWITTGVGEITVSGTNMQVGDELIVEYAYREPVDFQSRVPVLIGTSMVTGGMSAPTTSIPIPSLAQKGDLLTLGLMSGFGVDAYSNDSRMATVDHTFTYSRGSGFYVGYASNLSTPLSIFIQGNNNATGQFCAAFCVAWRGTVAPLEYDLGRTNSIMSTNTTDLMPGLGGNMSGAITCFRTYAGIGGVYQYQDWSKAPAYTTVAVGDDNYVEIDFGLSQLNPVPSQTTPNTGSGVPWRTTTIALK